MNSFQCMILETIDLSMLRELWTLASRALNQSDTLEFSASFPESCLIESIAYARPRSYPVTIA